MDLVCWQAVQPVRIVVGTDNELVFGSIVDGAQWPCSCPSSPSHLEPLYAPTLPCAVFVSVSCFRDIIISITINTTTKQQNNIAEHSSQHRHRPLRIGYAVKGIVFGTFDASHQFHRAGKGHRYFAPVAFPPRVNNRGIYELLRPSVHHNWTFASLLQVLHDVASLSPPRAPAPPRPQNGVDTTSQIAACAYTSNTSSRSAARQLRALLSATIQAHHHAEQSLRLYSLRPPT